MSGQRLTVPEPEIKLYEQGFEAASDLGREQDGKKLSDLVEKIEEPMVIAVDAPWGAGKSVFLKCWVGEHIKAEHSNEATTVYFDAFQHDFLDDPLIALTGVISERFTNDAEHSKTWNKLKKAAYKLRKPAVRIGAFAASIGISEIAVPVVDAVVDAAAKELAKASDEFWRKEDSKRAAMKAFYEALEKLAAEQKLIIVVDELDRCRPDYALNLLEVIKHFFNVPNVHFVLGVNLTELQNSVRARYGAGVNAGLYLQKFVMVTMPLPVRNRDFRWDANADHFIHISETMDLDKKGNLWQYVELLIKDCAPHSMTLRSIERLATLMKLSSPNSSYTQQSNGHNTLRAALLIIKACNSEKYQNILDGDINAAAFLSCFGLSSLHGAQTTGEDFITRVASYIFTPFADRDEETTGASLFKPDFMRRHGDDDLKYLNGPQILQKLAIKELEVFQLPS